MTAIDYGHRPASRFGARRTPIALVAFATALLLALPGLLLV
ncbi:hypothetical protein EDC65_4559 [Stella humosa]|uniref:Uncharacterized protein n=1 Tax=Stella humosa TaxID=94 RepID=A0A3N1KZ32_9PROT|nr:hypothetical protein [Stella humosa]ROP83910.1 hypothetical protein EDC65_4559 [Stella humosa]BBK32828.1 hypothetical protein STHU_34620 [Stella humosa]